MPTKAFLQNVWKELIPHYRSVTFHFHILLQSRWWIPSLDSFCSCISDKISSSQNLFRCVRVFYLPLLKKNLLKKSISFFFFSLTFVLEYSVAQRLINCLEYFRYPTFSKNFLRQLGEKLVCQSILLLQHRTV